MRILLAGQKRFGRDVLDLLLRRRHEVAAVACPTDREPADKLFNAALNNSLPVIKAGTLNAACMPDNVDLIVAAHSHDFIGRKTRLKARLGAIGYHPSLLPRHRGRCAIQWAIHMRERVTGGSIYWLNDVVDGGPIAAQEFCLIKDGDTPSELWQRELAPIGLRLFDRALGQIENGTLVQIPQEESEVTWEPAFDNGPRLYRPDLEMLGDGRPTGLHIIREKGDAMSA